MRQFPVLDSRKFADTEAEHVAPGETFVLTIPEMYRGGLKVKQRLRPEGTKNIRVWFEKTYFGDGTGFESEGRWQDFKGNDPPPKLEQRDHSKQLRKNAIIQLPPSRTQSVVEVIVLGGWCLRIPVPLPVQDV
jgi:hypothetical protein